MTEYDPELWPDWQKILGIMDRDPGSVLAAKEQRAAALMLLSRVLQIADKGEGGRALSELRAGCSQLLERYWQPPEDRPLSVEDRTRLLAMGTFSEDEPEPGRD